ncbi:hypothetical protein D9758_005482 [Tetrapyrgos nigripes]|uniref:NAD(P)-binding protein n=1 Tax=Tetrapyrgos nigripes TaxID=182062 RepID=A0A8H5LQ12_9AGAR|nr:hypothetical protein D9758_005482 [Tetrapyrgos nigripes]
MSYSFPHLSDLLAFCKQAWFIPAPKWSLEKMPDMTGKVVIVTGGSDGLGKLSVKALLEKNAKVYLAARNESKCQAVIDEFATTTGKTAIFLKIDLADLNSVKAAAKEFLSKETKLHVLYNNAQVLLLSCGPFTGVLTTNHELLTAQGYDGQFGTNVLGHFYLTKLLLPILLSTAEHTPEKVRIVALSSSAIYSMKYKFDIASLTNGPTRKKWPTMELYSQSKLGNILFANELARRYGDKGIVSTAVNPGNLKTDISRNQKTFSFDRFAVFVLQIHNPEVGVLTQLWAGTSPEGADMNGKFLVPWCREALPRSGSEDPELSAELWKWMEEQVEKFEQAAADKVAEHARS